jgi:hypothetical protein
MPCRTYWPQLPAPEDAEGLCLAHGEEMDLWDAWAILAPPTPGATS